MRKTHGHVPPTAVGRLWVSRYDGAMKSQPHRNTDTTAETGHPLNEAHSNRRRGPDPDNRRTPPSAPDRRYPSLSDDGQLWFPGAPWVRNSETDARPATTPDDDRQPDFPFVRIFALAAIVAIIATLVARA